MFTQPKDPNNKNKPAYKKFCSYCHRTNHSISACFKKQRDDEDKQMHMLDQNLRKNHFLQYFRSPSNDRTKHYDKRYRSRSTSRNNSYNNTYTQNRYRSTSRDSFNLTKVLLIHNTRDHDMTLTHAFHGLSALQTDLRIDFLIDTTLALDIDHALIQEIIIP